ncbi:MAG: oxidoreductase [Planctomycetaceae bacterium]|nr:oxidoreductase [Planctomycetaceae bacterium]
MTEKVKWGILGCSRIARTALIPALRASDQKTELTGIASRDLQTARNWATEFGIPRFYGNYNDLVRDPDIDVVYIGLPNHLHCEWTLSAAQNGKHVLCDKPLACHLAEAKQMAACCSLNNVMLMEGFMWRHHPRTQRLAEFVDQGKIGRLQMIRYSFALPMPQNDWRWNPATGGGALWDIGCYGVNTARLLCNAEPVGIQAFAHKEPNKVDVTTVATLLFPDNVLVQIDCGFTSPFRHRVEVIGSDATLLVTRESLSGPPPQLYFCIDEQVRPIHFGDDDQFVRMVKHFTEDIQAGCGLRPPAENGVANMQVLDHIAGAIATRQ